MFGILNLEDDYIDTPTLIKKVKLAKNVENKFFHISFFFYNLYVPGSLRIYEMHELNRLKFVALLFKISGRLLKRVAAVSWKVLFSRGACNLIKPEERKLLHIETLCKFKYEGHCLA